MRTIDFTDVELSGAPGKSFYDAVDETCRKRIAALTHDDVINRSRSDIERECTHNGHARSVIGGELVARIKELCPEARLIADTIIDPSTRADGIAQASRSAPNVLLSVWDYMCLTHDLELIKAVHMALIGPLMAALKPSSPDEPSTVDPLRIEDPWK